MFTRRIPLPGGGHADAVGPPLEDPLNYDLPPEPVKAVSESAATVPTPERKPVESDSDVDLELLDEIWDQIGRNESRQGA
jgi:hypothetical protein